MGYDLHITRAKDWAESETCPIQLPEWHEYVTRDPEIKIDQRNDPQGDGSMVLWFGKNSVPDDSEGVSWFCWNNGQVETKSPEPDVIQKMLDIAVALKGRVVGDDGEEYRDSGEIWSEQYIGEPPNFVARLRAWWSGKPLPEREGGWVPTGKWKE